MPIATPHGPVDNYRLFTWLRQQRHRTIQFGLDADCTKDQLRQLFEDHRWRCAFCGNPATHAVRLFPRHTETPLVPSNIAPSCKACSKIIAPHGRSLFDLVKLQIISKAKALKIMDDAIKRESSGFWLKQLRGDLTRS